MKKGKKRLLLGWICLLLSLCMVTVASAETDGTPIQPCHQVTMTEQKHPAQNGASISVWQLTTVLGTVDAELNALADDYAAANHPRAAKAGEGTHAEQRAHRAHPAQPDGNELDELHGAGAAGSTIGRCSRCGLPRAPTIC